MWAAIVNTLIGVWLMIAPDSLGFEKQGADSAHIVGPLVVTAGLISIWEINRSFRYINLLAGLWLIAASLLIHRDDYVSVWNNAGSGVLLVIFSLIKGKIKGNFGGGWRVLFNTHDQFFKNKVIVITGATGGVGRVTAWAFAKQGAKVALIARDKLQLEGTAKEVEVYGGTALAIAADVADHDSIAKLTDRIEKELGPIDVWINNAMNSVFAPIMEIEPEEFKRVTDVTYLGSIYGTMAALKKMKPRNKGSIVFVGSALAYRGIPLQSAYCGAKHAMQGFYDSLRVELKHDKSDIKLTMVQLPAMNTTQFGWVLNKLPNKAQPMGKVYQPEVAAKAILFAARHNRREIIIGFPSYKAIWGNAIAPWYADWVLARRGYQGQQTQEPVDVLRKDNLWKSVGEDRGAYGPFDSVASKKSFTLWLTVNRNLVSAICAAFGMLIISWLFLR
jgi:short-subunit dehydrogenase